MQSSVSVTTTVDKLPGPGAITVIVPLTSLEPVPVSMTVLEITTVDKLLEPGAVTVTVPFKIPPVTAVSVAVTVMVFFSPDLVSDAVASSVVEVESDSVVKKVAVVVPSSVLLEAEAVIAALVSSELLGAAELRPMVV